MLSIETCSLRTDISILLHGGLDLILTILVVCKVFSSKNEILQGQFEKQFALELSTRYPLRIFQQLLLQMGA